MFIVPICQSLRGFNFDPSGFSKKDFYVDVFFMPLYVPTKQVHLTFGHRVGSGWNGDSPSLRIALASALEREAAFLRSLQTPKDIARALEPLTRPNVSGYVNPHCYEAFAYTLVQAGEISAAQNAIDALLKQVDSSRAANNTVSWELEIASRALALKTKLTENPERAMAQLAEWQFETVHNLGLESYWNKCA